jgi:glucan phosphorylase
MLLGALTHRPGVTAQVGTLASKLVEALECDFILVKPGAYSCPVGESYGRPDYAGGLGVLAGDTLRSAADLALPLVAVTLVSRDGYFYQVLDAKGQQTEHAATWDPAAWARPLDAKVAIQIENRAVWITAWLYMVESHLGGTPHPAGL